VLERLNVILTDDLDYVLKDADLVVCSARHSVYSGLKLSYIVEKSGRNPLVVDTVNVIKRDLEYSRFYVLGTNLDYFNGYFF